MRAIRRRAISLNVAAWRVWREVARLEWRLQMREFLTWVYLAVFFFLTFGYTSSSAVELVSGRDGIARNAPWALAHAMAGVTAFGQIITTMIAATAVMRDVATRTQELLFTTRLSRSAYLGGRYAGALAVMLLVYSAIPIGLVAGTVMPWVDTATLLSFEGAAYARPIFLLVLPNVIVVSALFFAAGALRQSFMAILLLGLALVVLWTSGTSAARSGAYWGALIDPFGNAALEFATRGWTLTQRGGQAIPISGALIANRAVWLTVAALAMFGLSRAYRFAVITSHADPLPRADVGSAPNGERLRAAQSAPSILSAWISIRLVTSWTLRWILREKGFLTLVALGTLNALVNAWRASTGAPDAGVVLANIQEHVRVFLILVATIYAGELVWRERDVRSEELVDALPASTGAQVTGRILGLLIAEAVVVAPLVAVALGVGWARHAVGMTPPLAIRWVGGIIFPFLACITLLSLAIHAALQHKVAGHVTLIIGWVFAVALERTLALPPLARYANLPPFTWSPGAGFGDIASRLIWTQLYWLAIAATLSVVASAWWVRGATLSLRMRARIAARQLQRAYAAPFIASVLLAALSGWLASRA